jgi:hypothetical protein
MSASPQHPARRLPRVQHALAAVLVLACTLTFPARADAAPVVPGDPKQSQTNTTLCTVDEWQNPANWKDCAQRGAGAAGQTAACVQAPVPDSPDSGLAGWATSRPDADLQPGIVGRYTQYGVGGYQLSTYDTGCLSGATHPVAGASNTLASLEFTGAAAIIGTAGALRERAYNPQGSWGFLDGLIAKVVDETFRYVFTPWGILGWALTGLYLMWRAGTGRLSEQAKLVGWTALVTVAMIGLFRYPLWAAHGADSAATSGLSLAHTVTGQGPQSIPADRCHNPNPDACVDHRTAAVRASDTVVDAVLYRSWLRAQLGSADSPAAKMYGPALYDAQTLSWDESATIAAHPEVRKTVFDEKAARWNAIAAQLKQSDPAAYEHLRGTDGTARIGSGAVALLSALAFAGFDVTASLFILFGFLLVRVVLMCLPMLAAFGVFQPASGPLRRAVDAAAGSLFNIVLFGALSGVYLTAVSLVYASALPGPFQVVLVLLVGVCCWLVRRPARRVRDSVRLHEPARSTRRAGAPQAEAVAA